MASKKRKETVDVVETDPKDTIEEVKEVKEVIIKSEEKNAIEPKAKIGEIVYVSRDADTDLNGFKLFPQYKKYTYTVEDYNQNTDVYSLRRANLLLKLKGEHILRPEEKAHDKLNRIQF